MPVFLVQVFAPTPLALVSRAPAPTCQLVYTYPLLACSLFYLSFVSGAAPSTHYGTTYYGATCHGRRSDRSLSTITKYYRLFPYLPLASACRLPPTTYRPLPITYYLPYLLPITHYLPYLLPITHHPPSTIHSLPPASYYPPTIYYLLLATSSYYPPTI